MARYTGPVCKLCRREGVKLYLKGDRCYTEKCSVEKRAYAPGEHGQNKRKKLSEYGLQLREKQKARRIYGVLEKQFVNYFEKADRQKGVTGENLLRLLERRFDNVVYRLGFVCSRAEGRQLVKHDHFTINGHKANIPSMLVDVGDVIQVKEKSMNSSKFKELGEIIANKNVPAWLELDKENLTGTVLSLPNKEQNDVPIDDHLIVELYSR
ncbi:MAG: 30S ribosomal protein S4 [Clostridia bacterium]|nr:30S ribosomal protein S4 [Clostridia bacterium]MDD4048820.1 30S ribosomal protein S4 [Clostridia bacterium]